jgi:hypothetical protein
MRNMEDRIQHAMEIGERNQKTVELIRNWCAHVSVKKWGGGGIVEAETGLPIGPRLLECPHAPASGMTGSDLTMIAVDFYDRNCADCKLRKPVGLPNLKSLIDQRDAERARQQRARQQAEQETADRLAARETTRQQLRLHLDALSATTLDQISELDRTRNNDAGSGLVQIAELAPETFTPEIVTHLFDLIDSKEYWLTEPCLGALARLPVDKKRLCNTALAVLRTYSARDEAAKIIEANCQHADDAAIEAALPDLVRLANPAPSRFGFSGERIIALPGPLREAYRLHRTVVKDGLKALLEKKDAESVRRAVRGIAALSDQDSDLLSFVVRELVSKLTRAKWLIQGRDEEETDETIRDVRRVLVRAFAANPKETDAVMVSYVAGATPEGENQLYHVYRDFLWADKKAYGEEVTITDAHRIAFRRLVTTATERQDNDELSSTAQQLFHGAPYELTPLAGEEIDLLLGSAAVVAQKLKEFDDGAEAAPKDFFALRERDHKRWLLSSLEKSFVRWACTAAGRYGAASVKKVLSVLEGLPEDSNSLRAAIVRHFDKMMVTTETLALCLPHYYTGLVGPSQLVRASAAEALGAMSRRILQDLPSLVFEAFSALLTDSYVIVHRTAVKALQRFRLPVEFDAVAKDALVATINYYAPRSAQDSANAKFLMEAIDLYANRYATEADRAGRLGDQLIAIMKILRPMSVADELRHAGRSFRANPNYAGLLFKLLDDEEVMSTYHEDLVDEVEDLPKKSLYEVRGLAVELAHKMGQHYRELLGALIEGLTAAGAWKEATEITAAYDEIEDTTRTKPMRLHAAMRKVACAFEMAIAGGEVSLLEELDKEWKTTLTEFEHDQQAHKERRDPLHGIRGAH